ncbi:MAG: GIY-YIG nuclease family protein [Bacteroidia bacterium]|nr:GIY-YIG nuclease family protein [Bacteroidia bacterium]
MKWTVYILYSESGNVYYKGISSNIDKRLNEHKKGMSRYTSKFNDWILVYES